MRTFLFDIDGTLVDSSAVVERAWRQVAEEFGLDGDLVVANCHGRRSMDTVEEFFAPEDRRYGSTPWNWPTVRSRPAAGRPSSWPRWTGGRGPR
jgi:beta-phosphoglucomutase-like phosphatase (HAD superfamily)